MIDAVPLHKLVTVNARFARSVSLVRDFDSPSALDGYILTPIGRDVLGRLQASLRGESATRAWSLTGPYGAGKSAFALFVAQLLAGETRAREQAREFLKERGEDLWAGLFDKSGPFASKVKRLFPVLVTGSRQPLDRAIAGALAKALQNVRVKGRPRQFLARLEEFAATTEPTGVSLAGLFEEANDYVGSADEDVCGILLIIDELGKFLEYGASHPDRGDVFVLQELAEAASRSERPFVLLTILHQAIDRYAELMSASRRSEWSKVQGRFEDVSFEERTEQLVRLLSHAIQLSGPEQAVKPFQKYACSLASVVGTAVGRVGTLSGNELATCLAACYPLHPLTALTVGPLFRQLAQNERSLFAFLVSSEANGFQDFLRHADGDAKKPASYRLDALYDYLASTLGSSLFLQHRGKAWAEVEAALERLNDAPIIEARLAKVIGLLQALGPTSPVPASRQMLILALRDTATDKEIEAAIDSLQKKSVVIYRRHLGSYALWEGSDIEIEARIDEARRQVDRDRPIASFLMQNVPPQPLIARRHYFQKGTLRYFEAIYADKDTLCSELSRDLAQADGRIIFCVPMNAEERRAMEAVLESPPEDVSASVLAALPHDVVDLGEYCHDVLCLRWAQQNTPELEGDRIASRELHSRLTHAEQRLQKHLEWVFTPLASRTDGCSWYAKGRREELSSLRAVNDLLSRICDEVYPFTPTWRNELINRRTLSSAAAAARRDLIEAMIQHGAKDGLGFDGVPPERCMYETILRNSRLHRKQGDEWGFFPPDKQSEKAVKEIWHTIDRFLTETEPAKQPLSKLFDVLRHPPFGLKDGVLPVIFAAALLHYDTEVALYEDGTFVAKLTSATFERMFRSPEPYEVQRYRIAGPRYDVFRRYASLLTKAADIDAGEAPDLLSLVKPLARLVKGLPPYVGKTHEISDTARSVLRAVQEARQPDRLLFSDIPKACGFAEIQANTKLDEDEVSRFFDVFRGALAELQRAYPQLLMSIQKMILDAFEKKGPVSTARQDLEHDARTLTHLAVDAKLKAFLGRAIDTESDDNLWVESIANLLANRPPQDWNDQDKAKFEVQLTAIARSFRHFHILAYELRGKGEVLLNGDAEMMRVSVTLPHKGDFERIVRVPPELEPQAKHVQGEMRRLLSESRLLETREIGVAVLAQLVHELLVEERAPASQGKKKPRN